MVLLIFRKNKAHVCHYINMALTFGAALTTFLGPHLLSTYMLFFVSNSDRPISLSITSNLIAYLPLLASNIYHLWLVWKSLPNLIDNLKGFQTTL